MRIPQEITSSSIEELYDEFNGGTINVPINFKTLRLGLLARLCQFFITCLKSNPGVPVKFYQLDIDNKKSIEKLLQDPHNLTAILMADQAYAKDKRENDKTIKSELKSNINQDIQARLNRSIFKSGHRFQLFAVDHSISKYAYPECFYFPVGTETLRQSSYYAEIIDKFLNGSVKIAKISKKEIESLGEIIYELIENTEQHGKTDYRNGIASRSVRGLVVDYKMLNKNQDSQDIGGEDTVITEYLEGVRLKEKPLHLLEISIFDSGPGVAKTLSTTRKSIISNVKDEASIVSISFAKGITSKASNQGFGRGLNNVRTVLSMRSGFISIRTGRVSLYRNFKSRPLFESENEQLELHDESSREKDTIKELKSVDGLACSILVPLA